MNKPNLFIMFQTYLVRIAREYGGGFEDKIVLSQPNGSKHVVHRGKLTKEEAKWLKKYQVVRFKFERKRWWINMVVPLENKIREQLVAEHKQLIPFKKD